MPVSWDGWKAVLALAIIGHAIGQSLISYALAELSTQFVSIALLIQPVVAAVLAVDRLRRSAWRAANIRGGDDFSGDCTGKVAWRACSPLPQGR